MERTCSTCKWWHQVNPDYNPSCMECVKGSKWEKGNKEAERMLEIDVENGGYKVSRKLKVGDIVQHFKRETLTAEKLQQEPKMYMYEVKGFAIHTETKEEMVIYKALYYPYDTFARPLEMAMSKVDKEKYPDIKQEYRIEIVRIVDKVDKAIRLYSCVSKSNYPTKLIVGYKYWEKIVQEVKEHMVMGLTHYPDGSHTKLFGIPVTVDKDQPEIIEIGEVMTADEILRNL